MPKKYKTTIHRDCCHPHHGSGSELDARQQHAFFAFIKANSSDFLLWCNPVYCCFVPNDSSTKTRTRISR